MGTSTWFRRNCRIRAATHKEKQKIDLGVVIQTYEYTEGKWKLTSRYVYTHEQIQMALAAGSNRERLLPVESQLYRNVNVVPPQLSYKGSHAQR